MVWSDGVEDGAEGGLGLRGLGAEGLDGLGQRLELVGVGGRRMAARTGPRAAWACSGSSRGAEGLDGLGQGPELVGIGGGLGMAARTGPRAAWACSGRAGPRAWTAWARA